MRSNKPVYQTNAKLKPINREQDLLMPLCIESLVEEDHPVRAIWEYTGKLNLNNFYDEIKSIEGMSGCSAYDPRLLIAVWIYAYSEGIGSAREIARLCMENRALQWLTGVTEINYHTLSDFRINHKKELDELFAESLGLMSAEGLITLTRVGQDRTKIKANAGSDTFRREEKIKKHLELAREQIKMLDETDEEIISARRKKAVERAARERQEKLEKALVALEEIRSNKKTEEEKKEARASIVDPESRIMKHADGAYAPSYNVQIATDSMSGMIIETSVGQCASDQNTLITMVERIQNQFGENPKQMLVDGGYNAVTNIVLCENKNIDLIAPIKDNQPIIENQFTKRGITKEFFADQFKYDESNNNMTCPAGNILDYEGKENRTTNPGVTRYFYRAPQQACMNCKFKKQCCPESEDKGRAVTRKVYIPEVVRFKEKMETEEAKNIYKKRGALCEFTNACIKTKIGLRQFHVRGLEKVKTEVTWVSLTHNIRNWIRLKWLPSLELNT